MPLTPANMVLGNTWIRLRLGCDCLGHIHYFDAWHHDWHGKPKPIRNAICMHEEDYGILWKHTDPVRGTVTVRRSRRLVISAISNIGNYVYGFFWYFYQDGSIGVESKATGIPHGTGARPMRPPNTVSEWPPALKPMCTSMSSPSALTCALTAKGTPFRK